MTQVFAGDVERDLRVAVAESASWLPLLLLIPFAVSGLVDLPRWIHFGSISALGMLSLVELALAVVGLAAAGAYPRTVLSRFAPYGLFVGWMICRSLTEMPDQSGVQNGVAYLLFAAEFLLAGTLAAVNPEATMAMLRRGFRLLDAVGLGLLLVSFLLFGLPTDPFESGWLVGPRSVALLTIVPIAWHLAGWCHDRPAAGLRALAWILGVTASLSRTGTAVAFVATAIAFIAHAWMKPVRLVRKAPVLLSGAALLLLLVLTYASNFYERFFEGYTSVEVGGVLISTSGRNAIWPVVIESGMQHPIIGGGLGTSQAALADFDPNTVGHPHNDYLRVWHDGGIIGLGLVLLAFIRWLIVLRRQWVRAVRRSQPGPEVELAALITLVGIMLAALTDNGFVYAYVMGLAGLVIGVAMGVPVFEDDRAPSSVLVEPASGRAGN